MMADDAQGLGVTRGGILWLGRWSVDILAWERCLANSPSSVTSFLGSGRVAFPCRSSLDVGFLEPPFGLQPSLSPQALGAPPTAYAR